MARSLTDNIKDIIINSTSNRADMCFNNEVHKSMSGDNFAVEMMNNDKDIFQTFISLRT